MDTKTNLNNVVIEIEEPINVIINKGTGAGGANTNYYGKKFEEKINLKRKKYTILNTIFNENNIAVLFGDNENYFETFDIWFNNSL